MIVKKLYLQKVIWMVYTNKKLRTSNDKKTVGGNMKKYSATLICITAITFSTFISCSMFYEKEMSGELHYRKADVLDLTHRIQYVRSDQEMQLKSSKLGETKGLLVFVDNTLTNNHPDNAIYINELVFYMYNENEINIWTITEEINELIEPGEEIEVTMKDTVPKKLLKDFYNLGGGINYRDDWPDRPD